MQKPDFYFVQAALLVAAAIWANAALAVTDKCSNAQRTPAAKCKLEWQSEIHRKHSASDVLWYELPLDAEQPIIVKLEPHGLDLIAEVWAGEKILATFNAPHGRDGREWILLEPSVGNHYTVKVYSEEHTSAQGAQTITVFRAPDNDIFLQAVRQESKAARLSATAANTNVELAGNESWRQAYNAYTRAAEIWSVMPDEHGFAHARFAAALIRYWHLWEWQGAASDAAEAAASYKKLNQPSKAANALHLQAAALLEAANETQNNLNERENFFQAAATLFQTALAYHRSQGNGFDTAQVLNNIGLMHYYQGNRQLARSHWQEAAESMRELGEWQGGAFSLINLSLLDSEEGQLVGAINSLIQLLDDYPPNNDPEFQADVLDNLAVMQNALGRTDDALKSFNESLEIDEQLENSKGKAQSLNGIASVYYGSGRFELAEQYLHAALPFRRQAKDGRGEAWTLRLLGDLARRDNKFALAEQFHRRALDIAQAPTDQAPIVISLARDLAATNMLNEPAVLLNQTLEKLQSDETRPERASLLLELARIQIKAGNTGTAKENAIKSLSIYRALADRTGESGALLALSRIAWDQHEAAQAIDYAYASLAPLEALRGRVIDPELRATFLATKRQHFEWLAYLLMTSGSSDDIQRAFEISEHSRSRLTIDLLAEVTGNVAEGIDPRLSKRRRTLYDRLAGLQYQLKKRSSSAAQDDINTLREALRDTETNLHLLNSRIRLESPRYAALTNPAILKSQEIQARLSADTTLLQIMLGEDQSFAWLVTADRITGFTLPPRSLIEPMVKNLYLQIKKRPSARGAAEIDAALNELSESLIMSLAQEIDTKKVLIAADGALHYFPFALLRSQNAAGREASLLDRFELAYIPSVSALAAQDAALAYRSTPSQTMAIFADGVFSSNDQRLKGVATIDTAQPVPLLLSRLPGTAVEARRISALMPEKKHRLSTGFAASRQSVLSSDLQDYRIVHFATHGLVDTRYPALSTLAMSFYDDKGQVQDGLLPLHEIFELKLNADLVTLSACDTALGREISGESLLGFTMAFRYAGARQLLATLWQVPDRASAELMTLFYQEYLRNGGDAAAALRKAQLSVAGQRRWSDPYYWAAFVLQ